MPFVFVNGLYVHWQCDKKEKDACDDGCSGGLMTNSYNYLIEAGGIQEESSYPYTGKREKCKFKPEKIAVQVLNFTTIAVDESQILAHLVHNGPLAGKRFSIQALR